MPHIHEKYDFTVGIYLVYDHKVLLVNHPRYNMWAPVGGHIELDEDPEEALFREIAEEVGIEATIMSRRPTVESKGTKPLLLPNYLDVHEANAPHKHINFTYFAKAHSSNAKLSNEHSELKWFTQDELHLKEYNLTPAVVFYAEEALALAHRF